MKKLLVLFAIILLAFTACEKENTYCFECKKRASVYSEFNPTDFPEMTGLRNINQIAKDLSDDFYVCDVTIEEIKEEYEGEVTYNSPEYDYIVITVTTKCDLVFTNPN